MNFRKELRDRESDELYNIPSLQNSNNHTTLMDSSTNAGDKSWYTSTSARFDFPVAENMNYTNNSISDRPSIDDAPLSTDLAPLKISNITVDENALTDDFDVMADDLRSTFSNWIKKIYTGIKSQHESLLRDAKELEKEKSTFIQKVIQERDREAEKLAEDRRRQNAEIASQLKQVHMERDEARRRIADDWSKLDHERDAFRKYMQLENEKFKKKVEIFEQEKRKIVDGKIASETMIDINVGGVVFETSRQTLTRQENSYLSGLVSGRYDIGRDRQGRIFLDRDYELFRVILNFLRNPTSIPVPKDLNESLMIMNEAMYYKVKFSPYPLVLCFGGHNGKEHLRSMELLDQDNGCWRSCSPMQTERIYFGGSVLNNFLYVFGGQNLDYKALCETEMYDRLRDSWHTAASLKHPRRNNGGVTFENRIYCVGGFDGMTILDSVEAYDIRMKNWIKVAPLKTPRSSPMVSHQNECIYAIGGTNGERLKTVERYDPRMDQWELLSNTLLEVRSAGSCCTFNNEMFVVGGIDNLQNIHSSLETWDSKNQTPSFLKDLPVPAMDASIVATNDSLLLTGGQNTNVLNSTYLYHAESDHWTQGKKSERVNSC